VAPRGPITCLANTARPAHTTPARGVLPLESAATASCAPLLAPPVPRAPLAWLRQTDPLALAAAACGFVAIVPILTQLAGLALGIASLVRIRRARRRGIPLRGVPWALAGLISSGFVLLSWVAVLVLLLAARTAFAHVAGALPQVSAVGH
jgi:hypothetical protein